jgi:hypothetical protein
MAIRSTVMPKAPKCKTCGQPIRRVLCRPAVLRRLSELDWNLKLLAARLGISHSYMCMMVNPLKPIPVPMGRLVTISQVLHLPINMLLEKELDATLRGELEFAEKVRKRNRDKARRVKAQRKRQAELKAAYPIITQDSP